MRHILQTCLLIIGFISMSCSTPPSNNNDSETSGSGKDSIENVIIGYIPLNDWEFETQFPHIQWKYLTHVNVSFARAKADGSLNLDEVKDRIKEVRETAHKQGVKILISVAKNSAGEFTVAIRNPQARTALAKNIVKFTRDYQLDGFDIDYEEYENWDTNMPDLLAFAKELHIAKDSSMLMTCAVVSQWLNYTTEWEQYFDYINIMSYDKKAFTDTPTQHASYDDFINDLAYWVNKFKTNKNKIVGGLPFYGYSWDESLANVVDDVRGIRYHTILEKLGTEAANKDNIGKTYYNGIPTIKQKCAFVKENGYAGVMIWQLFQDAHEDRPDLKLIQAVGKEMKQ